MLPQPREIMHLFLCCGAKNWDVRLQNRDTGKAEPWNTFFMKRARKLR